MLSCSLFSFSHEALGNVTALLNIIAIWITQKNKIASSDSLQETPRCIFGHAILQQLERK